jgi:hypothetical protein
LGIAFSFLEFFDVIHKQNAFHDPVVALGSLNINESEEEIQKFVSNNPWWHPDNIHSVRSLLRDRYGILDYKDIDINGKADSYLDLNRPLDPRYQNSANVVLNGGTLEHIFDVAQALKDIHAMLKAGGVVVHLSPVSWYNHGYYNFNPLLFHEVAVANDYQMLAEAFYCHPSSLISLAHPAPINYDEAQVASATVYITFNGTEYTQEKELISSNLNNMVLPSNLLYMVAYKSDHSDEFVYPVDCH